MELIFHFVAFVNARLCFNDSLDRCRHSKCELAKMLNKEKSFTELLEKKDSIIRDKDELISRLKRDLSDKNK